MAIWQYRFTVIPKHSALNDSFKPQYDDEGLFEDDFYWSQVPTSASFFHGVEEVIPKTKSWSDDLLLFGNEESNCFEVYKENENVKSVSLRVSFATDYEAFLRAILEFIHSNGLVLLDEESNVLDGNYLSIRKTIESSQQFDKYIRLSFG